MSEADWPRILGANLAIAGGLDWSFRLGRWSCPCGDLPDPDAWHPGCNWLANPDARPRPGEMCSCSDEAGDSRCAKHPTCAGCGCSVERLDEMCEGCEAERAEPIIVSGTVGRCSRCHGWTWFARGDSTMSVNAWAEESRREGDIVSAVDGDIGPSCTQANLAANERTCAP